MNEVSAGCGFLLMMLTCFFLGMLIENNFGTNSLDFNGYRVCLENSKPGYCDAQFKDVHEFLKKNKLKLDN